MNRRKNRLWSKVLVVSVCVLVLALAAMAFIGWNYWHEQQKYNEVENLGLTQSAAAGEVGFGVDWDALKAVNPDVVGWVYVPNTVINYPIVQTDDNTYYLCHNFWHENGWVAQVGCIFLACENASDFTDANNIVYGHHMNNGSMFGAIADMVNQDMFNSCRTVYVLTPAKDFKLRTFSLVHAPSSNNLAQYSFANENQRQDYLAEIKSMSVVNADSVADTKDMTKTFMFSTCDNLWSDGRYLLFAYVERELTSIGAVAGGVDSSGEEAEVESAAESVL